LINNAGGDIKIKSVFTPEDSDFGVSHPRFILHTVSWPSIKYPCGWSNNDSALPTIATLLFVKYDFNII
jgi:hypothetical protein